MHSNELMLFSEDHVLLGPDLHQCTAMSGLFLSLHTCPIFLILFPSLLFFFSAFVFEGGHLYFCACWLCFQSKTKQTKTIHSCFSFFLVFFLSLSRSIHPPIPHTHTYSDFVSFLFVVQRRCVLQRKRENKKKNENVG